MFTRFFSIRTPVFALVLTVAGTAPGCDEHPMDVEVPVQASAVLRDGEGRVVGTAEFRLEGEGLRLDVSVEGIAAGPHGIHLHTKGACEAAGTTPFGAAGGHLNAHGKAHGLENPQGFHTGDLPNLPVGADGKGTLRAQTSATPTDGPTGLFDADGSAVVIHAGPDDQRSDPAGNSGARIACGVIERRA